MRKTLRKMRNSLKKELKKLSKKKKLFDVDFNKTN